MDEITKERQILMAMRKTLAKIVRDLTPNERTERYPLSDDTVEDVKHCFDLIAARERELAQLAGYNKPIPISLMNNARLKRKWFVLKPPQKQELNMSDFNSEELNVLTQQVLRQLDTWEISPEKVCNYSVWVKK